MNFAQHVFNEVNPGNRFLEEMSRVVPWEILKEELEKGIERKSGGRPPYSLLLLFKMHLLQVWFGLSDAGCEYQIKDRLSFREFLGLGIHERIPEATTLENFRHDFEPISERVLARLDGFFKEKGLLLREGNVVDATFIQANSRPHKDPDNNSDIDADHGHKGFGYTATVNVDVQSKLIRKAHTESARPHDSQHVEAVLLGDETLLYGDSGYQGTQELLEKKGCKARIMAKRQRGKKGESTPDLPLGLKYLNRLYAKTRVRVEHVFACWKTTFNLQRAWYRGLERVNQQVQSLALAYNLRRYGFLSRA